MKLFVPLAFAYLFVIVGCATEPTVDPPSGSISIEGDPYTDHILTLSTNITNATEFLWDFGDGSRTLGNKVFKKYRDHGVYTIKCYAKGEGGKEVFTSSVTIEPSWVLLQSIEVLNMPFLNPDGMPFDDDGTGPEVKVDMITSEGNRKVYSSQIYLNVTSNDLPITVWAERQTSNNALIGYDDYESMFRIGFYDYDGPNSADLIGILPSNYISISSEILTEKPESLIWEEGDLSVKINLSYF